jgi:hypothetical protein
LIKEYGSIINFILWERLKWDDMTLASDIPFQDPSMCFLPKCILNFFFCFKLMLLIGDIKILRNDWPYGIDEDIVHLVVWTKFPFQDDPETGDLTVESRKQIDEYVKKTFYKIDPDHVSFLFLYFCFPNFFFVSYSFALQDS